VVSPLQRQYTALRQQAVKNRTEVEQLLSEAKRLRETNVTSDENSERLISLYKQLLEVDPENTDAISGLDSAVFAQLAYINNEMDIGQLEDARYSFETLKRINPDTKGLSRLEIQLVQRETIRGSAMAKLDEAKVIFSRLKGAGADTDTSKDSSEQYAGALITAYKATIMAKTIDTSTPGTDETIKDIESVYLARFRANIDRKDYEVASIYAETMEKSGIYTKSAIAIQNEMRGQLDQLSKRTKRSFPSF
jgi:tetratricopeptide (TPR) repeat protein